MTLQVSGAIAISDINVELGRAWNNPSNMNEAALRTLTGVPSGIIWMSNFYGKSNRVTANLTIGADTLNYVLNTAKVAGYQPGNTDVILTINSGIYVGSSSPAGIGLDVDTSWNAADKVTIVNNGFIVGCGGAGGAGSSFWAPTGGGGGGGGIALRVQRSTSINNAGVIGGGGGGGGGGAANQNWMDSIGGSGGGGQGYSASNGGSKTAAGTTGGCAAGGAVGGTGGSLGAAGSAGGNAYANLGDDPHWTYGGAGGPAGACTSTGSNAFINWVATGTRYGVVA